MWEHIEDVTLILGWARDTTGWGGGGMFSERRQPLDKALRFEWMISR